MTTMKTLILGGGVTGLAAGMTSGLPVFEAVAAPGGICSSYYVRPGETQRLPETPEDEEAYRFEIGGGHWIFGGDPIVLQFISDLTPVRRYARKSGVWFPGKELYIPYPLQNHLRYFPEALVSRALREMSQPRQGPYKTMHDWLLGSFGPTLCETFFVPFHELYTAGLYRTIAPQDAYKSPVNLSAVIQGIFEQTHSAGYNVTYLYPREGLNTLAQRMAARCDVRYGKRAVAIDLKAQEVHFEDGSSEGYDRLLSTLPLNKMIEMSGLALDEAPAPYTSVLVLNIGATRGPTCPDDHWLYHPNTSSGFHRTGIYSNVDRSFLPRSAREAMNRVSLYIERAFVGGTVLSEEDVARYGQAVVDELTAWGFIEDAEVVDPTWIDVAYTWSWPDSQWPATALRALQEHDVFMIGRYGRWIFQGIADSIRDGFYAGAGFRTPSHQHEAAHRPTARLGVSVT